MDYRRRLREIREDRDLTQKQIAKVIQKSQQGYSHIENGRAELKIEDLMDSLKEKYTVIIVTHNMQQATRIADYTAFFLVGEVIEYGETEELFSHPKQKKTEDYVTGRFG